jgi:hypothetical protein
MSDNNMASKELPFSIHIIRNTIGAMAHILSVGAYWQSVMFHYLGERLVISKNQNERAQLER